MEQTTHKLGVFQRLGNALAAFRSRTQLLSTWTSSSFLWNGLKSSSGQTVNQASALSIPAFYRGTQIISETMASLKLEIQRVDKDGNIEKLPNHPLSKILNEPSQRYTGFSLRSTIQAYALIKGNGYAFISRSGKTARPTELRVVAPDKVQPYINDNGDLRYKVWDDKGNVAVVEFTDMIHIPNLILNGDHIEGLSPITVFKNSLGLPLAMTDYAGRTFKDGSPLQGILSTDKNMTPPQIEAATAEWKKQLNNGNTPILPGSLKFQAITLSPEDALFVDNYKLTVEDISRILGVPMHMLSALDRATFSNIEEQSREFVQNTIRPWVKRTEAELERKLLFEREKGTIRIRFNMESLLRGSMQVQSEYISKMVLGGIMSRNEARKYIGMNSIEGLDEFLTPVQFLEPDNEEDENQDE
jgi:HK97 family phage portal protein